jgi:hypothetical protein
MSTTDSTISQEWFTRPADQRFLSLTELHAYKLKVRQESTEGQVSLGDLRVRALDPKSDSKALVIEGRAKKPYAPTHHSFAQLCKAVDAMPSYLTRLPAKLTADVLNWHIQGKGDEKAVLLLHNGSEGNRLMGITSPTYGRIHDSDITRQLVERFGDGVSGDGFRVPGEFGKRVPVTRDNTTLYAGDRDMTVALADEDHRIEIPNRRDGKTGSLARGFYVRNSEVGGGSLELVWFLFDYFCQNRTIWGVHDRQEIRIKHYKGAPDRWLTDLAPQLADYANQAASLEQKAIAAAVAAKIGKVEDFAQKQPNRMIWTGKTVEKLMLTHVNEESRPIETLWDMSVALTAYARTIPYQDERLLIEREAGRMLKLAA